MSNPHNKRTLALARDDALCPRVVTRLDRGDDGEWLERLAEYMN